MTGGPTLFEFADLMEQRMREANAAYYAPAPRTIEERALVFHNKHPEVYEELVRLARVARQQGRHKIGIAMLWERMRWSFVVDRDDVDDFKLNNDYKARYARWILERERDLEGIFDTRELRSL